MAEEKILMKGNEAIAESAIRAGCKAYFGYPITPQNELIAYMSRRLPSLGRTFIQAESEIAAINMVYGAAATGARAMTSSSSPGIALKQEGISYACGADLPCVIANISRSGPGLGGISPAQGDYYQSTRGGGHGDYHTIVLAPKDVQEAADLIYEAFDLSDEWRIPALLLADGLIGQMMEGVVLPPMRDLADLPAKPWAVGHQDKNGRPNNHVSSMNLVPEELETMNIARFRRYAEVKKKIVRFKETNTEHADLVFVSYGSSARICWGAILAAKKLGIEIGLYRPVTLWPYPDSRLGELAREGKRFLCVEMSMGQMVEDVRLAVNGVSKVDFYGRCGGIIPSEEEVLAEALRLLGA